MKMRMLVVGVLILLGLSACQSMGTKAAGYFSNPVSAGTELELTRELRVPAGLARVYLQGGEARDYGKLDQYQPFCYFLMNAPAPTARNIRPTVFTVRSVGLLEQDVRRAMPVRLAFLGIASASDDPGVIAFETHMLLDGGAAQGPEWLVCSGAFAPPAEAEPIRLPEMRQALGAWVVVRVPGSTGF